MKIAILGYGIEGKSAFRYFEKQNSDNDIDVFDQAEISDGMAATVVENFQDIDFASYDTIVRSPSVRPDGIRDKIIADKNGSNDFNFTSATKIFFDKCQAPIIGVTGTKGKGTTASFITEILRAAGQTVHLVGNIGVPALDILDELTPTDFVVYELSSFQLWDIEKSPHVAVLTIIEPDHLDVHDSIGEYVVAKSNIVKFQTQDDLVVYNKNDSTVSDIVKISKAKKIAYPNELAPDIANWVKLPGQHNVENAMAAATAVWDIVDGDLDVIKSGIESFVGLEHRLKFIREVNGVEYYDDSIATTPGSAISAIKSFGDSKILVLGGSEKNADYTELGQELERGNVRAVYAIGDIRDRLIDQINKNYTGEIIPVDYVDMRQLVGKIAGSAKAGEIVILSPAAASFGLFKNYSDRGSQFISAVNEL